MTMDGYIVHNMGSPIRDMSNYLIATNWKSIKMNQAKKKKKKWKKLKEQNRKFNVGGEVNEIDLIITLVEEIRFLFYLPRVSCRN